MSARPKIRKRHVALGALILIPYCVAFHIGTLKGRAAEEFAKEGNAILGVARLATAYAFSHEGAWPPMDSAGRRFAFAPNSIPEGFTIGQEFKYPLEHDAQAVLLGPIGRHGALPLEPSADPASCFYVGYAVASEAEGMALVDAMKRGIADGRDITVEAGQGTLGGHVLYTMRRELYKTLAADAVTDNEVPKVHATFPVVIQRPREGHAWVVYSDLHAEYLPYPGPFPLTRAFVEALR
ncbi:MAG: hypothetical protein WC655_12430 [Candidatus Hydrogenedentales bacterium]|jgi:hypothetical protein